MMLATCVRIKPAMKIIHIRIHILRRFSHNISYEIAWLNVDTIKKKKKKKKVWVEIFKVPFHLAWDALLVSFSPPHATMEL